MDEDMFFFYRYYDTSKGWDNDKPGWYLVNLDHKQSGVYPSLSREAHVNIVLRSL